MRTMNAFARMETRTRIVAALISRNFSYVINPTAAIEHANNIIEHLDQAAAADVAVDKAEWEEQERAAFKANCGVTGNSQEPAP